MVPVDGDASPGKPATDASPGRPATDASPGKPPTDADASIDKTLQKGAPFAVVYARTLWRNESFGKKVRALLSHRWAPSGEQIQKSAGTILRTNVFGGPEDYGDYLIQLATWHFSREWRLDALTAADREKINSIDVFTGLTRSRFKDEHYTPLPLWLAKRDPNICALIFPMALKAPVIAIRYYLDIHYAYTFNAVRKARHSGGDALISVMYDLAFIQQKIAVAFHEYIRLLVHVRTRNNRTLATNPAVEALRQLDNVITLLQASVEKIISFVGVMYGLPLAAGAAGAAGEGFYAKNLEILQKELPREVLQSFQWHLIEEFVSPANLEALAAYGNGLLYKKGTEVFAPLHEQHARNTAALLGAMSLLTDKLALLDPFSQQEQKDFLNLYNSLR